MNVPVIPVLMVELVKMQQILTNVVAPQDLLETDVKQTFTPVMVKYVRTVELLEWFQMKQTKMYVCTLEEFILVDIWIHCCTKLKS